MTDDKPESSQPPSIEDRGERPDLGRRPDALIEAVSGSGMGSDTRAGSLQGGAATGSEIDPDQAEVDRALAEAGRASADPGSRSRADPDPVVNTGVAPGDGDQEPAEGRRGDAADAATG